MRPSVARSTAPPRRGDCCQSGTSRTRPTRTSRRWTKLRRKMRFLDYAPILHISALTGERSGKVLETIDKIATARQKRIPTPALNRWLEAVTAANPPVSPGSRHVRILYAAQIGVAPPKFVFFTNVATTFHFSYERFLVNQLRDEFGFVGSPIRVQVRRRKK